MDTIQAILTRKSIRKYTDEPISDADVKTILAAGMSAPSAANARPWQFIVVRDREMLEKMSQCNGKAGALVKGAAMAILICGDMEKAIPQAPDYWVVDGAIAGENMLLAAHALGLGAVWVGTWPQEEKVKGHVELFRLPAHIIPHSVLAFGHPAESREATDRYEEERVHMDRW